MGENSEIISKSYLSLYYEINNNNTNLICLIMHDDSLSELEVAKSIKAKDKNVRILIIDLLIGRNLLAELVQHNIDGYIISNFKKKELAFVIQMLIEGKKYYDGNSITETVKKNNFYLLYELTDREKQVFDYMIKGMSNSEIAHYAYISENTVKKHVGNILSKLNMKNRKEMLENIQQYSFVQ